MQKGEKTCNFWHHTLSSLFFVDLSVDIASNWNGVKAMRNLVTVKDLIGVTARRYQNATHLMDQKDHYAIGVAAPWWLHAW